MIGSLYQTEGGLRFESGSTAVAQAPPQAPRPGPQGPYPPQGSYDPRYDEGCHGHGYRPRHKRKKSWLEDIFDLAGVRPAPAHLPA